MRTESEIAPMGEFGNVHLSQEEHLKLLTRFGADVTKDYIERLSCWLKNTRKRRNSHYACILTWIRKDRTIFITSADPEPTRLPLIEEAELRHRAEIMQNVRKREGMPYLSIEELVARLKEMP